MATVACLQIGAFALCAYSPRDVHWCMCVPRLTLTQIHVHFQADLRRQVSLYKLRLCCQHCPCRLTNTTQIHELGPGVDHGTVLSHPQSLAALKAVLTEMLSRGQPGIQVEQPGADEEEEDQPASEESEGQELKIGGRAFQLSVSNTVTLPGSGPVSRQIEG